MGRLFVVLAWGFGASIGRPFACVQHVDERAAGIPHGIEHFLDAASSVVLDDEAGIRGDVGFQICIDAPGISAEDSDFGVVEAAGEGAALDEELDLETR